LHEIDCVSETLQEALAHEMGALFG